MSKRILGGWEIGEFFIPLARETFRTRGPRSPQFDRGDDDAIAILLQAKDRAIANGAFAGTFDTPPGSVVWGLNRAIDHLVTGRSALVARKQRDARNEPRL